MQSNPLGGWSRSRLLMLVGAIVAFLLALGFLILDFIQRRNPTSFVVALLFSILLGIPIVFGILRARR